MDNYTIELCIHVPVSEKTQNMTKKIYFVASFASMTPSAFFFIGLSKQTI